MRQWLFVGLVTAGCAGRVAASGPGTNSSTASRVTVAPVESPAIRDLLDLYAATCGGPEGVDDCSPRHFERTFARELPFMRRHRSELVARWMDGLRGGEHSAAYGLAWANAREALPLLREGLLTDRHFYGWESSDAGSLSARMRDDQYPHHLARILAIEALSGRPIGEAVALTAQECEALVHESLEPGEPGGPPDVARWLLTKLAPDKVPAIPPATDPAR